jgi:hypothetical protein
MAEVSRAAPITAGSRWARQLAGALILCVALALLAFVALNLARDASLWVLGRSAKADVVSAWIERDAEGKAEAPTFRWFVRYQLETPGGHVVGGVSRISPQEWAAMGHGGPVHVVEAGEDASRQGRGAPEDGIQVDVVYLPFYPAHNRLDESRFVPVLACAYVPLIFVCAAGLMFGRNLLRP